MYKGEDRRKYKRVKANVNVDVERYDSEPMLLTVSDSASKNISIGGILIRFSKPLALQSTVLVRFSLPCEDDFLEVVARTVRCRQVGDEYEIGLEFIDSMPEETGVIEKYVQEEDANRAT